MESARYFLPREASSPPNEVSEIFAHGTLIYTIMSGIKPYPKLSDENVEMRYRKLEFPETNDIICGRTILRCWNREYARAEEVVHDLVYLEQ